MKLALGRSVRASTARLAVTFAVCAALCAGLLAAVPASAATGPSPTIAGPSGPALAADLSQFRPGNIISDAVFYNSGTMSEGQIQAFLDSKVRSCAAGNTCLKDYYDTSRAIEANAMCGAYQGGGRERASTIIFRVAQACGLNPQVILVMLEKEQSLITHTNPSATRYRIAMGQGCPDTAACDTRYYGFFNQVMGAAWQLKRYGNPPGTSQYFTWYPVGRVSNVLYNPNAACGSSPVLIENKATAALYYYTPYQPNAAALRAGYGLGDGCSAYGNRNFFNFFTDWFGSTGGSAPALTSLDQSSFVMGLDVGGGLWGYPVTANGLWGSHVPLTSNLTGVRKLVAIGDYDGDGRRDVIGVDSANVAWLYRGDGQRFAAVPTRLPVDWSGSRVVAATGQFDGDVTPDVVTVDSQGRLLLWSGLFYGGFKAPRVISEAFGTVDMIAGGVDMNGDGRLDLVARTTAGDLYLHTGDGSGGLAASTWIGSGWSVMKTVFSPGDFTGDGRADILASNAAGQLVLYPNVGTGAITNGPIVGSGWHVMKDISPAGSVAPGARVFPAGAGDVNGDGATDVLARTTDGALRLYQGDGRGGWRIQTTPVAGWGSSKFVTLGDFDRNGAPDVARIDASGDLFLLSGDGAGAFAAPRWIGGGWGRFNLVIGGIDFDGDRKLDLLAREPSGLLYLYRGNGAGGWATGAGQVVGSGWNIFDAVVNIGDFDGNGRGGLAARRSDGALILYPISGAGAWGAARQIGSGWNGIPEVIAPGNFDGAGGPDLIARMSNGDLRLYQGDGKGGWTGMAKIGIGWEVMAQLG